MFYREKYIGDFYKVHGKSLGYGRTVDEDSFYFGFNNDGFTGYETEDITEYTFQGLQKNSEEVGIGILSFKDE